MCGINGFIQFDGTRTSDEMHRIVHIMNEQIIHRGPDSEGLFSDNHCALGMRRLSIIDLEGGQQPVWNEAHTMAIVFNGEIYNFKTLRKRLLDLGHHFTTVSDTEVILHGYEEWGLSVLEQLEGMFAFAIYDQEKQQWFLARDRIGEKPLYYYKSNNFFIFGSELKSLISSCLISKEINFEALSIYFQLTYIPAPFCIFKNVQKLMPSKALIIDCKGNIKEHLYWNLNENINDGLIQDYDECKRRLRSTMFKAVEQRLISDVPLGAFLSGGFDSSIIVGIMASISSRQIDTFTIGFPDKVHDETALAALVAKKHHTNHTVLKIDWDNVLLNIDTLLKNIDEPFADSSLIASYAVSSLAKKHVSVVLTGDAGDELFAGYNKYLANYYATRYKMLPYFLRKTVFENIIKLLPKHSYFTSRVKKVIHSADLTDFERIVYMMSLGFKPDELETLLPKLPICQMDFIQEQYRYLQSADNQTRTQYVDLRTVLEGDMLPKVDRASMLASLETRVPLLDTQVVELSYRIPTQYKINKRERKIIWKDTFRDLLPNELFSARKHGFGVPMATWLKTVFEDKLHYYSSIDFLEHQGLFDCQYIQNMILSHKQEHENRFSELWTLFVFQNWYERMIK